MLKYTYKSGGKVSKKDKLDVHVVANFPSKALIAVMAFRTSLTKKTEMTCG